MKTISIAIALCALAALPARADSASKAASASGVEEQASGNGARRRTVLRFGEDDIHGDITRPDGELVQAPRRPSAPPLLRVRKNFLDRALQGARSR